MSVHLTNHILSTGNLKLAHRVANQFLSDVWYVNSIVTTAYQGLRGGLKQRSREPMWPQMQRA